MLTGRIVAITGASGGIGEATARLLASRGATVVMLGRSMERLQAAAERMEGSRVVMELDVASTPHVNEVMERIIARYGRIDVLINNAGYAMFESMEDAPVEHYEQQMNVNYMGTVRCIKAALPHMIKAGQGYIINIASIVGKIGNAKSTAYAASKHAVLGLTNSLRLELMNTGITVTAINPGPVRTPFFDKADPDGHYVGNPRVQKFMLRPEDVAFAVLDAIIRKRAETDLPALAGLAAKLFHLLPRVYERFAGKFLNLK